MLSSFCIFVISSGLLIGMVFFLPENAVLVGLSCGLFLSRAGCHDNDAGA
jgi:hypothetical protein